MSIRRGLGVVLALNLASCETSCDAQSTRATPTLESFTEVDSESVTDTLRNRHEPLLLLNLWSTWCAPCVEEMPDLVELVGRHRTEGLGAVFISMDIRSSREDALRFMKERHAPSPSYIRTGRDAEFIPAIHPDWTGTLPATLLLDRERRPIGFWVGEAPIAEVERSILAAR